MRPSYTQRVCKIPDPLYTQLTVPFASLYHLQTHFDLHKHEFGVTTEADYERMADAFMSQAASANLYDGVCTIPRRDNGLCDRLRLDNVTLWYGVAFGTLTIRTLHKKPRRKITAAGGPKAFINAKCLEAR
jgi:hypothetical protein